MIRLPDIPDLQPTQIGAARVDPNAASLPARAFGETASAIARLGGAAADLADRVQKADDARQESQARQAWTLGLADLRTKLESEAEPSKIIDRTDEFLMQSSGTISQDLPPELRNRLRSQFDEFATNAKMQAVAEAARLSHKRAGLALNNEFESAVQAGDRTAFNRAKTSAVEAGILLPEQVDSLDHDFNVRTTYARLAKEISKDPVSMSHFLDHPEADEDLKIIGPENLEKLRRSAALQANQMHADVWEGILNSALNEGADQVILSKDDLAKLAKEGSITADQRAGYLSTWHSSSAAPFDPHIYAEAYSAISSYDPAKDPTGAIIANLRGQLATVPLPKDSLAELRDRLNERAKPGGKKASHRLAGDFQKLTDTRFNQGDFGSWFSWQDADGSPFTPDVKVIDSKDYGKALGTKRRFLDAWDAYLRNQPEGIDPTTAQKVYDDLFERIVLDQDDVAAAPMIPGAPPSLDFTKQIDAILGGPSFKSGSSTSPKAPLSFGGQPVLPPGNFYRGAKATIFGGRADPADNGKSAFGGKTGAGGREGAAIPLEVLEATFPGKDKEWFVKNVKVAVRTDDGRQAVFPLADLGTAEWVWDREKKPVLDLTEGAVRSMGGRAIYSEEGKLVDLTGIGPISFALTTANAGVQADLRGISFEDAQDMWFKDKRPTSADQIASGLAALKAAWLQANADPDDEETGVLPPKMKK